LVIGAGIGGLALANGLRRAGVDFAIFERTAAPVAIGAGVGLEPGALKALDAIGLGDAVRRVGGAPIQDVRMTTDRGRLLTRLVLLGGRVTVTRPELLAVLRGGLEATEVRYGSKCVGFVEDRDGVTARFEDGSEERGTVLIGADGSRSIVREQLLGPSELRYGGYTTWRSITPFPDSPIPEAYPVQAHGRGLVFGMYPVPGRITWFATANRPSGAGDGPGGRQAEVLDLFSAFHDPVRRLIEAASADAIDHQDVFDRAPVKRWSSTRVILLGDAAHPTTPSLGQGAGMALEDGAVLTRCLASGGELRDPTVIRRVFSDFERVRVKRTGMLVRLSRGNANLISVRSPAGVMARDAALSLVPRVAWTSLARRNLSYQP
jgi:2-polyprenyl-6-methoxyphenol hydroxylase-like FAD-dependent oxidoreductase